MLHPHSPSLNMSSNPAFLDFLQSPDILNDTTADSSAENTAKTSLNLKELEAVPPSVLPSPHPKSPNPTLAFSSLFVEYIGY